MIIFEVMFYNCAEWGTNGWTMNNVIMSAKKTNCSIDGEQFVSTKALLAKVKKVQEKVKDRSIDEVVRCAIMWVIMDNGPVPYEPEFHFKDTP